MLSVIIQLEILRQEQNTVPDLFHLASRVSEADGSSSLPRTRAWQAWDQPWTDSLVLTVTDGYVSPQWGPKSRRHKPISVPLYFYTICTSFKGLLEKHNYSL